MSDRIHSFSTAVTDDSGVRYRVRAEGEPNRRGLWDGWLVFEPDFAAGPSLRTGRETTQPNRQALEYWASGLEPIYLDGALGRARKG